VSVLFAALSVARKTWNSSSNPFFNGLSGPSVAMEQKTGLRITMRQVIRSAGTAGSHRLWISDLLTASLGLGESP